MPSLIPSQVRVVEQNPHQLGDRHRRVRIVKLYGNFLGEQTPVGIVTVKAAHEIGERAGDEKVFLHEAQALSLAGGVVGIQYAREGFGLEGLRQGADEIAATEFLKVKVIVCSCGPKPECIDGLAAVTHHRAIERHTDEAGWAADDRSQGSTAHLEGAVEFYVHRLVWTLDLPRVRTPKPVVRHFMLPAILDGLLENAVFVPQSIAHGWNLHRRHGVKKASRETPQTTITQTGVGFLFQQLEPVEVLLLGGFFRNRIEKEIGDVINQRAADEKLHREIVDALGVLALVGFLREYPTLRQDIAHGAGKSLRTLPRPSGHQLDDVVKE